MIVPLVDAEVPRPSNQPLIPLILRPIGLRVQGQLRDSNPFGMLAVQDKTQFTDWTVAPIPSDLNRKPYAPAVAP